jgi:uncharacterized membrane protein YhiD involved in acid resistance
LRRFGNVSERELVPCSSHPRSAAPQATLSYDSEKAVDSSCVVGRWGGNGERQKTHQRNYAASIWVTAAIGILVGIGFYFAALVGAVATLAILSAFRLLEMGLPSEFYAHHTVRFARDHAVTEDDVRELVGKHGFSIANLSYRLSDEGKTFEYRMVIRSRNRRNAQALANYLKQRPEVLEFRIAPMGD